MTTTTTREHWITELNHKTVDPPIHVAYRTDDPDAPTEPPVEPPVDPPVEPPAPELPARGILGPVDTLTPISGKYEPGNGETVANVREGYISVNGVHAVTIRNYHKAPYLGEATGDGLRIDGYDGPVGDVLLEHVHIGRRPYAAPGKHIDGIQAAPIPHPITHVALLHSIVEGGASAAYFAKKARGIWRIHNSTIGKDGQHSTRLHADPNAAGPPLFHATDSDLALVTLCVDKDADLWDHEIARTRIPGGAYIQRIDYDNGNRVVETITLVEPAE
jgi:hypothetical protein